MADLFGQDAPEAPRDDGSAPDAPLADRLRPRTLMPVHGEMRHMMEHARFATTQGVPQTIVQSDGDIVRLLPGNATKIGQAPVGRLVLDGDVILPSDGSTMNERRKLAINGQISVGVAVAKGRLVGSPQVRVQGVPVEDERDAFIAEAVAAAAKAVDGPRRATDKLREDIRLSVRKVATRWTGKKPIVDVLLIEG